MCHFFYFFLCYLRTNTSTHATQPNSYKFANERRKRRRKKANKNWISKQSISPPPAYVTEVNRISKNCFFPFSCVECLFLGWHKNIHSLDTQPFCLDFVISMNLCQLILSKSYLLLSLFLSNNFRFRSKEKERMKSSKNRLRVYQRIHSEWSGTRGLRWDRFDSILIQMNWLNEYDHWITTVQSDNEQKDVRARRRGGKKGRWIN